ncbi:hypothetical protein [Clavibacter michiganensis]|nr:hypothetical protein [Clavibacter michiganensis]
MGPGSNSASAVDPASAPAADPAATVVPPAGIAVASSTGPGATPP